VIRESGLPEPPSAVPSSDPQRPPDPARERGLAARPVLANTGALVLLRGSNLAVRLGLLFLIARQVVPQEFGRLVLALSVVEVAKVLADFGMDTLAIREFAVGAAGAPRPTAETATFTATFVSCRLVSSALVQAGLVLWFLLAQSNDVAAVGLVLSFSVWTAFLQSVSLDWFQGRLRVGRALVPALVTNVAGGLVAALALARIPGLAAKAVSLPVLELLVGAVLLVALRRERDWGFGRPSTRAARTLLLGSVPIAITAILIMLYSRLDVFVMASRLPSVDVGRYGIAFRFTEPFQIAAAVFGLSVYSRFVGWTEPGAPRPGRAVLRYTAGTLAYGAVAALGLSTLAPPLIERFLPAYAAAVAPLRILSVALLFRSLNATLAGMIQAAGHFRGLAALAGWNLVFVFALLLAFVPRFGVEGAALALAVGEGVNSLFQAVWVARIVRSQERASANGR
jgi:O-antigen/teichoic acid export membrane protein